MTQAPNAAAGKRSSLEEQLLQLSRWYDLRVANNYWFVIVGGVKLPPGYGLSHTAVLVELPYDYPISPPGVGGKKVYVSPALRYLGKILKDIHPTRSPDYTTPGFGPWAWWCYEAIRWDPARDDLIRFMELFRADLTNPNTQ